MYKMIMAALLAVAVTPVAGIAQRTRDSASGHGSIAVQDTNGRTAKRQFSFSAHRRADDAVIGNAILKNPAFEVGNGQNYQLQIQVTCMNTFGNIAIFGGFTRRTNDPNLVDAAFFAVEDNGEPGAGVDRISGVEFFDNDPTTQGDPQLCLGAVPADFDMFTIENGNINVRSGIAQ